MKIQVKNNISWVGKIDWELRKFHGNEYTTNRGSSYNSYLVQEEKTFLIDTVWAPFSHEFVQNLQKEVDLKKIDFIVANHGEVDHSGALPELLALLPNIPVYCTNNAVKSLKGLYHKDWNLKTVKTGDSIDVGNGKKLIFIEMAMLHWPDSMACYLTGDNVLFSNDAFGQHYASEKMFNDLVNQSELYYEATKYYANILTPFSQLLTKKLQDIKALNLPIDIICPSHGIIWRKDPLQIVEQYTKWANNYQEDQITLVYDSMWDGTRKLAEHIAKGIFSISPSTTIKIFNVAMSDKNDVMTDIFKSKAILVGSATINRGVLTAVAGALDEIKGLGFKNKKAGAFGCYGWSGEAVKIISEKLKDAGFTVVDEGIRATWDPDETTLAAAFEYGKSFVEKIKQNL